MLARLLAAVSPVLHKWKAAKQVAEADLLIEFRTEVVFAFEGDWFDHHGFQEARISSAPGLKLDLRVNRDKAVYEFMEPVILELKLTNFSSQPQLVNENLLSTTESMIVILKKDGKPARQLVPYAQYCRLERKSVLKPGDSIYKSLPVSTGLNGWDIAEPGNYTVQVALHKDGQDIFSNPLSIRVALPNGYDEETLAQDFFSDEVGRIITFGGSRFFDKGNDVLREVTKKLSNRRVALHASLALGNEVALEYKELVEMEVKARKGESRKQLGIRVQPAKPDEASKLLEAALIDKPEVAIETYAHVTYKQQVDRFSNWMAEQGDYEEAANAQDALYQAMSTRQVRGQPILDDVVKSIKKQRDKYATKK